MDTKTLELDDVTYLFRPANALSAWNALKKAGVLFKGAEIGSTDGTQAIGALLSNLGEPCIKDIETLVFNHINVQNGSDTYKLSNKLDEHFNQYRGHFIPVLVEGVSYQFADFLKGGMSSLQRLMPSNATPLQV